MDGAFFRQGDERGSDVAGRILEVARNIAATGGVFMLLWHNTMVDPLERPEQSRAYFDATRRLRELPAWWATVAQIAQRWKSYAGSLEVRDA